MNDRGVKGDELAVAKDAAASPEWTLNFLQRRIGCYASKSVGKMVLFFIPR